jgi:hypothetical protein
MKRRRHASVAARQVASPTLTQSALHWRISSRERSGSPPIASGAGILIGLQAVSITMQADVITVR